MEFSGVMLLILLFSLSSSVINSNLSPTNIKSWCDKTYFPETCENVLKNDPKYANTQIKGNSDFLKLSLQLAFDRAVNASKVAHELGPKCRDNNEKAAWTNCVDLYEKNVVTLKQSVDPNYGCIPFNSSPKCSPKNVRTWLSTALDNIDTCEQGFVDIDMTDNVMPLVLDKVQEDLIVNALGLISENN
ncbi:hypothetical protein ACH5RR_023880 [Cinchona calisaya]|uniref:Pectinesterase inhibitor domain-containing protein n=1 Tax=Cinchona calisaya TaxID=153742 RepID=A0ABD2ZGY6_9GENT